MESQSTSQARNVQPRMQSARSATKLDISIRYANPRKRARRAHLAQVAPQTEQDTHIDENGVRQPNPPMVNMLKIVNHIGATSESQEKHLKFSNQCKTPEDITSTI